ncbi:AIP3-domain-containing protein [Coniophora puteana RWD-64-598 SS2]|uniref:AIP3-domain-containing protein n=1 Tax=Coniophora puteana (strain RWD-64-598) TaxID=741705 RepID=A0A5M3MJ77_CONPW|nr:AIP3-domain-containing protein [Coniophora puteana RWD-64-598 SS2]EIW79298.1 AIP3-domain-containing protein [Coniophora puteana RWD-64-598 SS2]
MARRNLANRQKVQPSRRDTASSMHSSSSKAERSGRSQGHPVVESAVTRLLVAIKQLLESLTLWSECKIDEMQVSDVYVRLGNDFNAAVAAFAAFNIDMADLMSVPEDLREVLETCLAEDATPDNLQIYLPKVRQIITQLLQGLRGKQSMYRRIVQEHQHRHRSAHSRTDSRSSKAEKSSSRRDGEAKHRSHPSREASEVDRQDTGASVSTRHSTRSSRHHESHQPPPVFQEPDDPPPPQSDHINGGPTPQQQPAELPSTQDSTVAKPPDHSPPMSRKSMDRASVPLSPDQSIEAVPPSVKRYSLVDKPMPSPQVPAVVVEEPQGSSEEGGDRYDASSPLGTPPSSESLQTPGVASSLAALKKSEALERRASKRFSTYNISKITGSGPKGGSGRHTTNRRSLAVSSALTPGELAVLTECEEPLNEVRQEQSGRSSRSTHSPAPDAPPVPPLPPIAESPVTILESPKRSLAKEITYDEPAEPVTSPSPTAITVFLQVGREVKKATIEPGLTFSSLRVLFVDKFSYNPGLENFPAIYIRDPSSGVQYELEDIDEVQEKCLLSLNIEPLDQIKQHIDSQISTLAQDLKELKALTANNRRMSQITLMPHNDFAESTPAADRPTDKHFATVARRVSRMFGGDHTSPFIMPQATGQSLQLQPQMTGASVVSEYSSRVVNDLKTQFDEVQNLRRDLGAMRQIYTEFMTSTKESLSTLRDQTQSVKQLATAQVGGARGFIDSGKTKLDTRSQNVLTKVEELQDTVEALRDDVLRRHVTPRAQLLKTIKDSIATTAEELESLKEHINTIKPMWKKTWEEELQNIVEEQGFLGHQEEFLNDLLEDHKALSEVLGHVEKVISLRKAAPRSSRGRDYRPPPMEEGHTGLSTVMMEIRGASVDPERRLKAIAANQKSREKELATRSDEFQDELKGFVKGKKLKMTGGAEEAERVRQKRNDMTLKAMFVPSSSPSPGTSPDYPPLPASP